MAHKYSDAAYAEFLEHRAGVLKFAHDSSTYGGGSKLQSLPLRDPHQWRLGQEAPIDPLSLLLGIALAWIGKDIFEVKAARARAGPIAGQLKGANSSRKWW